MTMDGLEIEGEVEVVCCIDADWGGLESGRQLIDCDFQKAARNGVGRAAEEEELYEVYGEDRWVCGHFDLSVLYLCEGRK